MSFWVCAREDLYLTVSPNVSDEFFTHLILVSSLGVYFHTHRESLRPMSSSLVTNLLGSVVLNADFLVLVQGAGEGGIMWFKANLSKDFAMMDVSVIAL